MDTPLILLVLLLTQQKNINISSEPLHSLKDYLNTMEINSQYTKSKLKIARKIYPLLPIEYAYSMRKSISIVEKIIHLMETVDYLNTFETEEINLLHIPAKERIQKITLAVQDEFKGSSIENLGIVMDLVLNMDRYRKLLTTYNQVSRNKDILSDKDSIMSLMEAFMEGSSEKDKGKLKDMNKIFDLLKLLDSPKDAKPNGA